VDILRSLNGNRKFNFEFIRFDHQTVHGAPLQVGEQKSEVWPTNGLRGFFFFVVDGEPLARRVPEVWPMNGLVNIFVNCLEARWLTFASREQKVEV
jgi:hypothetical protein